MNEEMPNSLIEKGARAVCIACHENPDHSGDAGGNQYRWQDYVDVFQAALSVIAPCYEKQIAELKAQIPQWQRSIDTVSSNDNFLTYSGYGILICQWLRENYFKDGEPKQLFPNVNPTHFMPLPKPPAE